MNASRGFSFRLDGPLDMRMDPAIKTSAADIINWYSVADIQNLLADYGGESLAWKISQAIGSARKTAPISSTLQLAQIVSDCVPIRNVRDGAMFIHPATRTFQALRIAVNDELVQLSKGLNAAFARLKSGGVMIVVSFHALEDKIVKSFIKSKKESKNRRP